MAEVQYLGATRVYPSSPVPAVNKLDLDVADGEFMVLVGPSGSGKSTALRMLAGLEDLTEGEIHIGGVDVSHLPSRERDVAMVFQNYALYPHMSVGENMGFALKLKGVGKDDLAARVLAAAKLLDLEDYLDRKPKALSGGQRQRVAMGRAIVREPSVFLMDEPLSNLDARLRVETRANLAALQARLGTTTLYVTHDQVEAMTLGDRVALLRDGILQQVDTPGKLYDRPNNTFVAGFFGLPPMNLVRVAVDGSGTRLGGFTVPLAPATAAAISAEGLREVVLGIRPESLVPIDSGRGLPVKVNLVEPLGPDTVVTVDFPGWRSFDSGVDGGARPFQVRLSGRVKPQIGAELVLAVHAEITHVFQPETGQRIGD
ncbi:ABC transporter ATP-binding protein [Jatrophihabitans sp. DSM 45814]